MKEFTPYFNRELSWLSFNYRVLQEAADPAVPLYERVKFLAIYVSNLEEFFRVRVAVLRQITRRRLSTGAKRKSSDDPGGMMARIQQLVTDQHYELDRLFGEQLLPALRSHGIVLYRQEPLLKQHQQEIRDFFQSRILSFLQPVFLTGRQRKTPFMANDTLYFVVVLHSLSTEGEPIESLVHLNIPTEPLGHFVQLSSVEGTHYFIFLEEILRRNLPALFPGYRVVDTYSIKLDRSGELALDEDDASDVVEQVKAQLSQRRVAEPTRFLYEERMPASVLEFLRNRFRLHPHDLIPGGQYQNLDDLLKLPNPLSPQLENPPLPPLAIRELDAADSLFDALQHRDYLFHFPYQSYKYVLRFFNEAAVDPKVTEIKVTLYRIATDSLIANALISAARNGKRVTVFVEVKARFDEANNLRWAEEMEKAGIQIIYSLPGLKVHAKIALIWRRKATGGREGLAYLGTGNFNERTARLYADHGLLTTHAGMVRELQAVFNHLGDNRRRPRFKHLLVAQFNMRPRLLALLDREIGFAQKGKPARVIIKLNNLEERTMIDKLYQAHQAGVQVELLVRGICCLVPDLPGLSEGLRVIRIVDRFLEHSRIFYFLNGGEEELYLSSADWMNRNLHKRIEVGFPVYSPDLKAELKQVLHLQLADTVKARRLDRTQQNQVLPPVGPAPVRSQLATYEWLQAKAPKGISPDSSLSIRSR